MLESFLALVNIFLFENATSVFMEVDNSIMQCADQSSVFKIYRFLNLPAKIYRCRFCVNGRPIRHFFHRFQNVPASCESSLSYNLAREASLGELVHYCHFHFSVFIGINISHQVQK